MMQASHGMSRTFPPTAHSGRPVIYSGRPMPRSFGPGNRMNIIENTPATVAGFDPRLTAQGTAPTRQMPNYVPYAYLDPRNVFDLRPA